jgi:hypothetical protein
VDAVTPEKFRKDRYLRATGYNFYVWAVVNVLITWPLFAALAHDPWPVWLAVLYPLGCILGGIFCAVLNDNRVSKMCGEPDPQPLVEAGGIWGPVFLVGIVFTVVLSLRGPVGYVQPVWLLLVGCAYLTWGNFGVREFQFLGYFLVAAGAVAGWFVRPSAASWMLPSRHALAIWVVCMGLVWIPFGVYLNRRYLYRAQA